MTHISDLGLEVKSVSLEWFKQNVRIEGWIAGFAKRGCLRSVREDYPNVKFKCYQVHVGDSELQGTWAISENLAIQEKDLPDDGHAVLIEWRPKVRLSA